MSDSSCFLDGDNTKSKISPSDIPKLPKILYNYIDVSNLYELFDYFFYNFQNIRYGICPSNTHDRPVLNAASLKLKVMSFDTNNGEFVDP